NWPLRPDPSGCGAPVASDRWTLGRQSGRRPRARWLNHISPSCLRGVSAMTNLRLRPPIVALTACLALTSMPSRLLAAPPEPTVEPAPPQLPKPAKRKLITGGTLIGLGFALELTGAVISSRCTAGEWCSRGFAVAFGPEAGPNRYTMVSTGPSSTYVIGRIAATPVLIG